MNFLAHIYLSGDDDELKIGNFAADSIKGNKYLDYPKGIQKGIKLHRKIDSYTDTHPIVRQSTARLFSKYGHYNGVIVDILYDHFLAANWKNYSQITLKQYVNDFYTLLQNNLNILPQKVQNFLPYMIEQNWLASYATVQGIGKILYQMNQRTKNKSKMNLAITELETYYDEFQSEFFYFFEELELFVKNEMRKL